MAIVCVAYVRVYHAGFIWDDEQHLTENPCIVGPLGLKDIWTTARAVYYPLVLTTFWVFHKFVGLNPAPYHLLNIGLHGTAAVLLWLVLRELRVRGAWLGAAIWGLHPVMVQSVAWITELKNTQSAAFYLLSILCFIKIDRARGRAQRWGRFGVSLLFFIAAVASKPSTVVLPVVLGLCLWWQNGRLRLVHVARLSPFLAVSIVASAWTIWEQKFHSRAIGSDWSESLAQRFIIAGRAVWFYLSKLVWPARLTFIYPRWEVNATRAVEYLPLIAVVVILCGVWLARRTKLRPAFFAGAYFVICLFPVLGFFSVYFFRYAFVSDHFQYLASMGPLALVGAGLVAATESLGWTSLRAAISAAVLAILGALTSRQTAIYRDVFSLYADTIAKNPGCWMAHYNLAIALRARGDVDGALAHYREAIALRPNYSEAHFNLGRILVERGRLDEAATHYRAVLNRDPNDVEALNNLGNTLLRLGRADDAITTYERALSIRPDFADAAINLADAFAERGETDRAIQYYTVGLAHAPSYPHAQYNLANALLRRGRVDEAVTHYRKAIELDPQNADARANLGSAVLRSGDVAAALSEYREALRINGDNLPAQTNLAWILATTADDSIRNGREAILLAENANRLSGERSPAVLRVLAASYAADGRFADAIDAAERALEGATVERNGALRAALERELSLYRAGTAYGQATAR